MSNIEYTIINQSWIETLESEYQEYMWQCESSIDGEEDDDFQTISGEIFCGCETCFTREQLSFLVPRILEAYLNKDIVVDEN